MKRLSTTLSRPLARLGLVTALLLSAAGCGGGSSGGGGGGGGGSAGECSTAPSQGDCSTATSSNGSTTFQIANVTLTSDDTPLSQTTFSVTLKTPSGAPIANGLVRLVTAEGAGVVVTSPEGGSGRTNGSGVLNGTIQGVAGGSYVIQAIPDSSLGLNSVSLSVAVTGAPPPSPPTFTPTQGGGPTSPPGPTSTPTVVDVANVAKLVVQVNPYIIKSALGGDVTVTVIAYDENNLGVGGVRLLLDANPRGGTTFDPQTPITNNSGIAQATLSIAPGAEVGDLTVTATGGMNVTDSTTIQIVSGASERPAATVVLSLDQPVIGTDSGGTASLRARVYDADNVGLPNVNVLFTSEIGQVVPPVEVTCGGVANPCPPTDVGLAQTTLTVPPNAVIREYNLSASAGGVSGTATIAIVAGRGGTGTGNPNAAAGEPTSINLGASPPAILVSGVGGTEQATVIARVFDNNNNPLSAHVVALRVVPDSPNGAHMLPLSGVQPPPPAKCLEDPARQAALDQGRLALGITDRAGFVLASVQAGAIKGTVTIEACADSVNQDQSVTTVVTTQSVVSVAAGPPASVTAVLNDVFVDNNDGTLITTAASLVKDANGNTVEDNTPVQFTIENRTDVSIIGGTTTNNLPGCDTAQFPAQTGLPVTAQPGTAITCITYPAAQAGTVVELLVESAGITNNDNSIEDENFNLPPGSVTGPADQLPSARNFSLASEVLNLSGLITFGLDSTITAFLGDRNGNPVKRNTIVNFSTDFGGVTSQGLTNLLGRATGSITTQGALPPDGLVTVTATTIGEEDFTDVNGNGVFDEGVDGFDPATQDQDGNNVWSASTEISTSIHLRFSGGTRVDVEPDSFTLSPGEVACFNVEVKDGNNNPIVGGSTVTAQAVGTLTILGSLVQTVPDTSRSCAEAPGACNFFFCAFSPTQVMEPTTAGISFLVQSNDLPGGGNGNVGVGVVGTLLPPSSGGEG